MDFNLVEIYVDGRSIKRSPPLKGGIFFLRLQTHSFFLLKKKKNEIFFISNYGKKSRGYFKNFGTY